VYNLLLVQPPTANEVFKEGFSVRRTDLRLPPKSVLWWLSKRTVVVEVVKNVLNGVPRATFFISNSLIGPAEPQEPQDTMSRVIGETSGAFWRRARRSDWLRDATKAVSAIHGV